MARGRQDSDLEVPFRVWTVTVDDKHRLRLPRQQVRAIVSWSGPDGPIQCVATPGATGGIQLAPLDVYRADVEPIASALTEMRPNISDSSQGWMDVIRLLATAFPITINVEPDRISISLPEAMRLLRILPSGGEVAVVFGCGDILEVWDSASWNEHVRATARRKELAITSALENLRRR